VRAGRSDEWFRGRTADSISTDEINARFLAAKKENGWASQTVSNYQQTLIRVFQEAIDKKVVNGPNVAESVHRFEGGEGGAPELVDRGRSAVPRDHVEILATEGSKVSVA
jgi:hypothetical protein